MRNSLLLKSDSKPPKKDFVRSSVIGFVTCSLCPPVRDVEGSLKFPADFSDMTLSCCCTEVVSQGGRPQACCLHSSHLHRSVCCLFVTQHIMLSEPQHLQVPVTSGSDQKLLGELIFENVAL